MADTKISALPAATDALAAMELPVNDAGVSRKLTVGKVQRLMDNIELGGAASTFGVITFPGDMTRIWGSLLVKASVALVPRIRLGKTSIDTGANYASSNALDNANAVASTSFNGWNLIVAAMASGNESYIEFAIVKAGTARPARGVWQGSGISVSAATAPTRHSGCGIWVNTTQLIDRIEIVSFNALTGTTTANMDAGSELWVYASNEV